MKFAVIEYTSKSGTIWYHTNDRPNYLADPQHEIDPTSFGCYVSALEGQHIPITGLIHPTILKRVSRKLTGHWPTYDISYLKDFDALLIVHQISDGHEVTSLTKRIRATFPEIKILGVPTQPYGILHDYWQSHPDWLADFREFMDSCHAFITIVESTKSVWEKLTHTPVYYLPQPYPVSFSEQFNKSRAQKDPIIYVAGRTDRRNISKGLLAARDIQSQLPEYVIHATAIDDPGVTFDITNLKGAKFEMQTFLPWQEHLAYLASTSLVINTDYTQTRGRVQVDCAAVGTPSIGADSDGQADLFPDLPANSEQSVEELVSQGKRLLTKSTFYDSVIDKAKKQLQEYSYERSAERIKQLVASL